MIPLPTTSQLLDRVRVNGFIVRMWALCMLVSLIDGFDLTLISFVAPSVKAEMGLGDGQLGMIFAASLVGMAVGGPIFGALGDRFGRKPMIIASCCLMGLSTLVIPVVEGANGFMACRFVTGLGLSGAVPSILALGAEFSPVRLRGRVLALMGVGVPVGAAIPGLLTAVILPLWGWRALVVIGGLLPLILAIAIMIWLAESPRFLLLRSKTQAHARRILSRIDPAFATASLDDAIATGSTSLSILPSPLFRRSEGLHVITPLLWALFFIVVLVNFEINNWLPSILSRRGLTIGDAGLASAMWSLGGVIGGIIVTGLLTRRGLGLLIAIFVIAIPATILIARADGLVWICACVALSGSCIGALQIGLNASASLMYDTSMRVKGVGWALSVGRLGGMCGPLLAGLALSRGISPAQIFNFSGAVLAIGLLLSLALARIWFARHRSMRIEQPESALLASTPAG
ncbi:aromatic acid/H+ symport family MFS transporter [soil metagenome]